METERYHNLLQRQIKKLFGSVKNVPPELAKFLLDVNQAYIEFDNDRTMLERSLDLSSHELLQANSEMRGIFQALPDVYFLLDENGIILDCKGGTDSDFQTSREQLIGKPIYRSDDSTKVDLFRESMQKVLSSDQNIELEYSLRVGKAQRWYEARMVRLMENRIIVLARNITIRKHAEQHIEQSYSLLRATLESTADGILVVNNHGKIETYNQQFLKMWKIPEKIIQSRMDTDALEFVLDQLREPYAFVEKVHDLYEHPESESFDILEFVDGRIFERYSKPQIINRKSVGRVWSFRDVTERKNLENHLRQSQKLQSVGTLAGGVAHDFNNLLTIILGYSVALENNPELNSQNKEKASAIKTAAKRGAGLVRQLLTIARKTEPHLELVNVNEIILELVSMFRQTFPKTVILSTVLEKQILPIIADYNQIHQSILNLCLNARDAVKSNGVINIRTSIVFREELLSEFSTVPEAKYVCIVVTDTGIGMDEKTQTRIFEPFYTTKEPGKGTGLGLAVVYSVVNSHNGLIRVESKIGVGTSIFMYFPIPVRSTKEHETVDDLGEKVEGNREHILLVEDEPMLNSLIKNSLETNRYNVVAASDGTEAIECFSNYNNAFDLIVMDIGLPKLNGWDAYNQIKLLKPSVKVIFVSGYLEPELREEILADKNLALLEKPYTPLMLLRQIRKILDTKN